MSESHKGQPFRGPLVASQETRAKLSAARMGNKNSVGRTDWIGRTHTDETKAKISAIKLGKKHTAEARANMSRSKLGTHSRLGIPHSTADRAKISEGLRRYHANKRAVA